MTEAQGVIIARGLEKSYRTAAKDPGLLGTLKHFFRRRYKTVEAVRGVSFEIAPGEMVGFLGPNGAGKTTTLKMLTGLVHPSAGTVEVAGFVPFRRQGDLLRQITLVMGQKQQLIWDLPALDSLRINAAIYEVPPDEYEHRRQELAAMLGLEESHLKQPVRKLSLGERMKAELLAALIHRPKVLFLDEPTLGLDVNAQVSIREFLRRYNREHAATILLTSHYMADIVALCQRVLIIHKGQLIHDGNLDEILERFAPYREVKIESRRPYSREELAPFGEVESIEGRVASLMVRREELTQAVARVLNELEVLDLTVTDPPIERIIGRIFTEEATA
jgi:ABC-2 type transport system ATP-binding protein